MNQIIFNEVLLSIIVVVGIVLLIIAIVKGVKAEKHARSICPECKKEYSYPESFNIEVSELKWVKGKKEETKGDFTYEIEYKQYYRIIWIDLKCSTCGHTRTLKHKVNIWRSDDNYSYSESMDRMCIEDSIKSRFDKTMFEGKKIKINLE